MSEGYDNFSQDNFDPDILGNQTANVTQFEVVIDKSGSVGSYLSQMNQSLKELFMQELKKSHKAPEIVVKAIEFNQQVTKKSGFRPLVDLTDDYLEVKSASGTTALYEAVFQAIEDANKYRVDLELQGIDVKTNIFIVTDGDDTASSYDAAAKVKKQIEDLRKNEAWAYTFTINMLGIGPDSSMFEKSCIAMGLDPSKCLVTVSNSASEMREAMGVVSRSVSSSASGQTVNF